MKTFPFVPRQLHVLLNIYVHVIKKNKMLDILQSNKTLDIYKQLVFLFRVYNFSFYLHLALLVAGTAASFGPNCFKPCP